MRLRSNRLPCNCELVRASSFCLVLPILLLLGGCDEKKATASSPAYDLQIPEGEPEGPSYEDPDFALHVGEPELCPSGGVLGPQNGLVRAVFPVKITVVGKRTVPVGPMLFTVQLDDRSYPPTLASCRPPFEASSLNPGETIESHVAFDLPQQPAQIELDFEPFIIGRKKVRARVLAPGL